ncbi:MAG: hypothetical protein M1839_006139 [Geoglossum umbratile]|nr:MAG: hypothetical protein M1839_006139 [Geoglossum umbratile]
MSNSDDIPKLPFDPQSYPGILHNYAPGLTAFEYSPPQSTRHPPKNALLFVSGLGDGLLTVPYAKTLSFHLPPLSYTLVEVLLTSSYTGWGTGSVSRDAQELALCVSYFRTRKPSDGKIVLMGHSTGCQDTMEYLTGRGREARPAIDGAILQAPVSDREAIQMALSKEAYQQSVAAAQSLISNNQGSEILPSTLTSNIFGPAPCSAYRWYSLASSPHSNAESTATATEDFFSSDLPASHLQQTFGRIPPNTPLCILYSGLDQFVPGVVDKKALVQRWIEAAKGAVDERHSGIVEGATHSLTGNPEEVIGDLMGRVAGFLRGLEGGG